MDFIDYYKVLGIDKNATADEVKKAYRKLARKYHPDVSKDADAEARFKEVAEAYEVLRDPEKRKLYDQYGADWKTGRQQEEYREKYRQQYQQQYHDHDRGEPFGTGAGFDFGYGDMGGFSDFFESLFGSAGRRSATGRRPSRQKGEDVTASISIPITDAFHGATRRINFNIQSVSGGSVQNTPRSLNVKIPRGIRSGQKIRLAGQGSPGYNGGASGDMYITVEFEKHPYLRADGADIYLELPVAPWEAALGNTINVPAPGGKVKLKIPPGSKQGKKLRLKAKGIPAKTPGDLYVVINIVWPPADNEKARKIYEEMKDLNFDPRKNFGG